MIEKKGILDFLTEHSACQPVSFHMPGHKGSAFYRDQGYENLGASLIDFDITEIAGADNLFQTEGIIKETMEAYKNLYEVEDSYLLINGSSSGIIAAVLASVPEGGKLIMARNCHKSVFNALTLGGITPVYAFPEVIDRYGISGAVLPEEIERCICENPDCSAVILPSPNYYGICSDIGEISRIVHSHGKVLIVDQAHGAHLKFFDKYIGGKTMAAENLGADIVINSTHKTLASFTQTAVLNRCTNRISGESLEDRLQQMESTSPSYVLMASLDINRRILEDDGQKLIEGWQENIDRFYEEAEKIAGLALMEHPLLDRTKLNLDMSAYGIDGMSLEKMLLEDGIFVELVTGNILMCMTGIGNRRLDFYKLLQALEGIAQSYSIVGAPPETEYPPMGKCTQKTLPKAKTWCPLEKSAGKICALSIIPYPPGIPMVCPGEVISEEVAEYIGRLRRAGHKVMGVDGNNRVCVGEDDE